MMNNRVIVVGRQYVHAMDRILCSNCHAVFNFKLLMIWLHHIESLADCASGWFNARRLVTGNIQLCHSLQHVLELVWRQFSPDGLRVLTRYYRLTCTFSPHREVYNHNMCLLRPHREIYITNVCITVIRKRLHNTKCMRISSRRENLSICSAQYYRIQQGFISDI